MAKLRVLTSCLRDIRDMNKTQNCVLLPYWTQEREKKKEREQDLSNYFKLKKLA